MQTDSYGKDIRLMEPIGIALMTTAVPLRGNSQSAVSLHDDMTMTVACPAKVRELKSFVPEIRLSLLKYSLKSKTEDIENRPPPVILPCSDFLKVMTSRKRGNAARDDIVDDKPRAAFTTLSGSGLNRSQTSDVGSPAKKAREASRVDLSPRKRGSPRVELSRLEDEGSKRSRSDSLQTDRGESNRSKNEHDSVRVSSLGLGRTTERGKRQDVPLKQPVLQGNTEEVRRQKSTTIYSDSDSSSDIGEVHRFAYKQISSTRDAGSRNNHRGRKYVSSEEEKVQSLDRKSVASPEEIVQRLDPKSVPLPVEKFQRGVAEIPIDPLHGDVARPMHSNLFSDDEDVKADVQGQLMKVSVDILQKPDGTCSLRCLPDADLHEYVKLQNAKKDKVPVPLTSSSLKVVDPAKVKCVHMYPGVQFYKTVQTEHVKMGRLKIDPRTIKPVETLSKYEMVLTALSGCVIIKSVQFKLTSTGIPALKSCELPEGHELKIPNGSSYSIENWEDVQALLLFCLISN